MNIFQKGISIAGLLTVVVGCGGPGTYTPTPTKKVDLVQIDSSNEKTLLPVKEGNTWTYEVEVSRQVPGMQAPETQKVELVYKIAKVVKESATADRFVFEISKDGEKTDEQEWISDETGVYQMAMTKDRISFEPKQPILKFPVKQDETFSWKGTGLTAISVKGEAELEITPQAVQMVDTGVGSMSAQLFEGIGKFSANEPKTGKKVEGNTISNTWLSPGVGIVRFTQQTVIGQSQSGVTLRLKNYNLVK